MLLSGSYEKLTGLSLNFHSEICKHSFVSSLMAGLSPWTNSPGAAYVNEMSPSFDVTKWHISQVYKAILANYFSCSKVIGIWKGKPMMRYMATRHNPKLCLNELLYFYEI